MADLARARPASSSAAPWRRPARLAPPAPRAGRECTPGRVRLAIASSVCLPSRLRWIAIGSADLVAVHGGGPDGSIAPGPPKGELVILQISCQYLSGSGRRLCLESGT